jgi:hypothetical protein
VIICEIIVCICWSECKIKNVEYSFLLGYDATSLGNWFAVFSRNIMPSAVWTLWALENEGDRR